MSDDFLNDNIDFVTLFKSVLIQKGVYTSWDAVIFNELAVTAGPIYLSEYFLLD